MGNVFLPTLPAYLAKFVEKGVCNTSKLRLTAFVYAIILPKPVKFEMRNKSSGEYYVSFRLVVCNIFFKNGDAAVN